MNPGGGSGWDEPPLDIQIPDDARELERDVLAYHRELRAKRRRRRLRKLTRPFAGQGTLMPLLASILAVCLVAGAMLSVATFGPATAPGIRSHPSATATSGLRSAPQRPSPQQSGAENSAPASSPGAGAAGRGGAARPSSPANPSARSSPAVNQFRPTTPGGLL